MPEQSDREISPDKYFNDHIPHRVNLLISFRQRYSGCDPFPDFTLDREKYRDLYRCAKDMSFLMVRFFFGEMNITLSERKNDIERKCKHWNSHIKQRYPNWNSPLKTPELEVTTLQADPLFGDLLAVLKAANHAVAHVVSADVDHPFLTPDDEKKRVFPVIEWTYDLIKLNIYQANGRDLSVSMDRPNNDMKVTRPTAASPAPII